MGRRKKDIHYKAQTLNICTCGVMAQVDTFTWVNLGGHLVLLCWECTDKLHKKTMAEDKE